MQHLSIILAFCAVFGLAAYRVLDGQTDRYGTAAATQEYTASIPGSGEKPSQNLNAQLVRLNQRLGTMEGELRELRRGNERLKSTVRELAARDTITTSSIGKQSTGATTQLRNSGISSSSTVAVAQRPGRLGIHLATFADPATLGVAWKSLKAGEEAMLSRLTPYARAIVSSSGEKLYRLIAGPIGSQTEAMTLCRQMKARNRFCRVSAKLGTPLAQVLARN